MELIKVASNSYTSKVAGAIAGIIRESHRVEVQAIGAGAVNQALKAMILAAAYLRDDGIYIAFVPEFVYVTVEGNERTAIKFVIEPLAGSKFPPSEGSSSSSEGSPLI